MQLFKNLKPKERLAFAIISIIILFIVVIFFATFINRIGKVEVIVKYAPYAANISLNDVHISNNSNIWVEPGKYRLKVEYDHFATVERIIEISNDSYYVVGTLIASDNEGEAYTNKHKEEFIEAEGYVGLAMNQEGIQIKKQYPILNYLPINNRFYSISYSYANNNEPIISIKSEPEYLDITVRKIKSLENVNPVDYQINFSTPNPFTKYTEISKSTPEETIKSSFDLSEYELSAGQNIANDYYAATIYKYDYDRDLIYGHYRIALHKDTDGWHIIAPPQPLYTKYNLPNTSTDIINSINSLAP